MCVDHLPKYECNIRSTSITGPALFTKDFFLFKFLFKKKKNIDEKDSTSC